MSRAKMVKNISAGFLLAVAVLVNGCTDNSKGQSTSTEEKRLARSVTHIIEIKQMKFLPAELRATRGDTVVFVNHDLVTHDITETPGRSWHSSPLATDQRWSLAVTKSANYFCSIHPMMKGSIIVK